MTREEKLNYFGYELAMISNLKLREFVEIIIDGTGDWFFHDAASTSGKYHPKYALGDGGLARHTRAVVYFVNELSRSEMFDVNEAQVGLLIAAAIMHDIRKHTANGGYVQKHAREAYNLIISEQEKYPNLVSVEDAKYMADAVSTHMGIWGVKDGERKPTSDSEKLLHLADLMASRKEIALEIFDAPKLTYTPVGMAKIPSLDIVGEPKKEAVVKEEIAPETPVDDGGSYVITFGRKHPNRTIAEIYLDDRGYLEWIANNSDFFNQEARENVIKYLKSKQ